MEKLLFTGGTGFLGKNIRPILEKSYEVTTCGISQDDQIKVNLAKDVPMLDKRYDVVLHACGKAHIVPKTEEERKSFYDINYTGTVHLCKALEKVGVPKALVFISTMSVYGSVRGNMSTEETPLCGDTPYADSKIQAERYLTEWSKINNVILGILRPSLLAGRDAPGNLGSMVKGIRTGMYFSVAGGKARKSVLMVDDIARLVPLIAEKGGVYNVCDDHNPSFGELEATIAKQLGKSKPINIPYWIAKCMAIVGDLFPFMPINSSRLEKIVTSDTWSNEKAKRELGWQPMDVLENYRI